jgi:hypothetical protein
MGQKYRSENVGNVRQFPVSSVYLSSYEENIAGQLNDFIVRGRYLVGTEKIKCSFHFPRVISRVIDIVSEEGYSLLPVKRRAMFENLPVCYFQISEADGTVNLNQLATELCGSYSVSEIIEFCNSGKRDFSSSFVFKSEDTILTEFLEFPLTKEEYLCRCLDIVRRYYLYFYVETVSFFACNEKEIHIHANKITTPLGTTKKLVLKIDNKGFISHESTTIGYVGDFSLATVEELQEVSPDVINTQLEKEKTRIFNEVKKKFVTVNCLDEIDGLLILLLQQMMKLR